MDREWTEHEKAAFEDAISIHGPELRAVRDEVGTRSIFEVVRYYAHWKRCAELTVLINLRLCRR